MKVHALVIDDGSALGTAGGSERTAAARKEGTKGAVSGPRLAQEDVGENQDDGLVKLAGRARRFDAEEADAPPNARNRTHARAVA